MNNRGVCKVCSWKSLVASCRNSLTVEEYLLFCIYKHLYGFKTVLDEQGGESFQGYSLPEACEQGITLRSVLKCIECPSVRSAAVICQMGRFRQLLSSSLFPSSRCVYVFEGAFVLGEKNLQAIKACSSQILTIYLHICIIQYTVNPSG